jgi:hypothetical protein
MKYPIYRIRAYNSSFVIQAGLKFSPKVNNSPLYKQIEMDTAIFAAVNRQVACASQGIIAIDARLDVVGAEGIT